MNCLTWFSHNVYYVIPVVGMFAAVPVATLRGMRHGWLRGIASGIAAFAVFVLLAIAAVAGVASGGAYMKSSSRSTSAWCPTDSTSAASSPWICVRPGVGNGVHIDLRRDDAVTALARVPSIPPAAAQPN